MPGPDVEVLPVEFSRPRLTVVIPAFNEAGRLPRTLQGTVDFCRGRGWSFEVLVVDDGSTDATAALTLAAAPAVTLIQLPHNSGKGAAVRAGVLASGGELVLISDADLSTPIAEIDRLSPALEEGAGLAIGSRSVPGASIVVRQPVHREIMGKIFNRLAQALLLPGIHDTQCGFKLFRGDVARTVFRFCQVDGFAFDVEAIVLTRRLGYRVVEVPVEWRNSPESRVSPLRDSSKMLVELLRLRLRSRRPGFAAPALMPSRAPGLAASYRRRRVRSAGE